MCVTSSSGQTCSSIVSLEVLMCSLPSSVKCDDEWSIVYRQWLFFFLPFFSLFYPKKYTFVLFIFCVSISVVILLIFYFCSWPFYKNLVCFQFSLSITIYYILFVLIWSLFFWFLFFSLTLLLMFYCFSISSFNKNLCRIVFSNLALILLIYFFFY